MIQNLCNLSTVWNGFTLAVLTTETSDIGMDSMYVLFSSFNLEVISIVFLRPKNNAHPEWNITSYSSRILNQFLYPVLAYNPLYKCFALIKVSPISRKFCIPWFDIKKTMAERLLPRTKDIKLKIGKCFLSLQEPLEPKSFLIFYSLQQPIWQEITRHSCCEDTFISMPYNL